MTCFLNDKHITVVLLVVILLCALLIASLRTTALHTAYLYDIQEYVDHYMCHLGVGGFHRSHQCVYTDDLLNAQVLYILYTLVLYIRTP
jgi:Mannitol dehydrogenase Rossmann domain